MKRTTRRDRARAFSSASPAVRPDRKVKISAIPCPTCGAGVGEQCIASTGGRGNHPARRRMALRAEGFGYSVADVRFAAQTTPAGRRAARARSGLTMQQLADLLGVTAVRGFSCVNDWEHGRGTPVGPIGAAYGRFLREQLKPNSQPGPSRHGIAPAGPQT